MNRGRWFPVILPNLLGAFLLTTFSLAQNPAPPSEKKKRDPFVALVRPDGKIKSSEELFQTVGPKPLSMVVDLTAIIWDEKRPLAFINGKVREEGAAIAKGLTLMKIHPNSVELSDNGNPVTVTLRKTIKNASGK